MSKFIKFIKLIEFIRPYTGYGIAYLSYRMSVYILSELFNTIDEITDSNNTNALPDEINDISTKHKYSIGKKIVNALNTRGGEDGLIVRGRGDVAIIKRLCQALVSTFVKPVGKLLGYLLLKIPALKSLYGKVKAVRIVIASLIALGSLRLIGRYDYWALILSEAIPIISIDQKALLAGIRRMRMGKNLITVCLPQSNDLLNLLVDDEVNLKKKIRSLRNFFLVYEFFPENHTFKNSYFVCIIHLLLTLFIANKISFKYALKLLLHLLHTGQISLETYREIIYQLISGGVLPDELEIL